MCPQEQLHDDEDCQHDKHAYEKMSNFEMPAIKADSGRDDYVKSSFAGPGLRCTFTPRHV